MMPTPGLSSITKNLRTLGRLAERGLQRIGQALAQQRQRSAGPPRVRPQLDRPVQLRRALALGRDRAHQRRALLGPACKALQRPCNSGRREPVQASGWS